MRSFNQRKLLGALGVVSTLLLLSATAGIDCISSNPPPTTGGDAALPAFDSGGPSLDGGPGADATVHPDSGPTLEGGTDATDAATATVDAGAGCEGGVCVLVSDRNAPYAIAVYGGNVYWTEQNNLVGSVPALGNVMTMPISGGTPTTLAPGQYDPTALAVSSTGIYWANGGSPNGAVASVPLTGGTVTTLAANQAAPFSLVTDSANVYWSNRNGGTVLSVPLDGGALATLASGQGSPNGLAVDVANAYFTTLGGGGNVVSVPLDGGTPTTLVSGLIDPGSVAVQAPNVYWTNAGISGSDGGAVLGVPIDGGAAITIVGGQVNPGGLAIDGTSAYWANGGTYTTPPDGGAYYYNYDGTLLKIPLAGGTPITLASGLANPAYIAVDGTSVYWTNLGVCPQDGGACHGSLMKVTPK